MFRNHVHARLGMALAVLLGIAVGVCGQGRAATEYTLRFSGTVNEDHLVTKVEYFFRDKVWELSDGRIKIEVFPNNQLGSPREMVEATVNGDCDFVETAMIVTAGYTNKFKFLNLPFLWASKRACFEFLKSEMGLKIRDAATEDTNMITLGYCDNGFFNFYANKKMPNPEDVAGFKIRCQESDVLLQIWKDFGSNPAPLSFTELYTALQQGAMDGMMNGYVTTATNKLYEVQKYCHRVAVMYDVFNLAMNKDRYDSLPADLREVLHEAMVQAEEYGLKLAEQDNLAARKIVLDGGVEIIDLMSPEKRQPWLDKAQATYDWFRETYPEENLDAILEAIKPFNEKYPASDEDVI